jgi:ketosteroid isomerase-like protein
VVSPTEEVLEVLELIRDGWERMDGVQVLSCFEDDARTVVIGTDEPEYWVGYVEFEQPFLAMAGTFTDGDYRWTHGPTVDIDGDIAWSTGKLLGVFMSGEERIELDMRTTHVLRRGENGWRIVQGHYSLAAPEATTY